VHQSYRDFETLLIDGGSTDGTCDAVKPFPAVLLRQTKKYLPNALNCGVRIARGEILAFIDDDAIPSPDWLLELVSTYASQHADGVCGRIIVSRPKPSSSGFWGRMFERLFSVAVFEGRQFEIGSVLRSGQLTTNFDRRLSHCIEVDHMQGCNMSFRRDVFDDVGLFDEIYTHSSLRNESDFCLRIRSKGHRLIYNPAVAVYHNESASGGTRMGKRSERAFYDVMNDTVFILKCRRVIKMFSWRRFALRQILILVSHLLFALTRADLTPLYAFPGMAKGFERAVSKVGLLGPAP
jgi:GT2 family glycosyltransferase